MNKNNILVENFETGKFLHENTSVIMSRNLNNLCKFITRGTYVKQRILLYANFSSTESLNKNSDDDDDLERAKKYCENKQRRKFPDEIQKYWESDWMRHKNKDNSAEIIGIDTVQQDSSNYSNLSGNPVGARLTHVDESGSATMVDVGGKDNTDRVAIATAAILLGAKAFKLVEENRIKKGDVLTVSQLAGIQAAKRTSELIPLCHNIFLSKVDVSLKLEKRDYSIRITATAKTYGKTGVEMEALMAASVAAITVYDMCKSVTHDMVITDVKLLRKSGGRTGEFVAQ